MLKEMQMPNHIVKMPKYGNLVPEHPIFNNFKFYISLGFQLALNHFCNTIFVKI